MKKKVKTEEKTSAKANAKSVKRALFVCTESSQFFGFGDVAAMAEGLPKAVNEMGECEMRVILPLYESFPQNRRAELEFVRYIYVPVAWRNQYCGLFRLKDGNTVYYFVDNEYYFKRENLYGYFDDAERFAFFSRAVIELLPYLDFMPDVLHCNDWQTALVPIYYKLFYMYNEGFGGIKTVFTIHNIAYQGMYDKSIICDVFGLPEHEYDSIEHFGCINLMKGAIDYSDAVSTVSPTYAKEILNSENAHGLSGVLRKNEHKLTGILGGIDTANYDPKTCSSLFAQYSASDKAGKAVCKAELQKMLGLPVNADVPIAAMITRLYAQKGIDILRAAMNDLISRDVQFVILCTGESDYENYFEYMQELYANKLRAVISYNADMALKIFSAADMFLIPVKNEPCGVAQMVACRYGAVPIVHETGGLKDSITDAYNGDLGNGYRFSRYAADDLLNAVERATGLYKYYPEKWKGLVDRAMRTDFSWTDGAKKYVGLYSKLR